MDSAIPLLLFLAFLFGSVLLILVMGYQSREAERTGEKKVRPVADLAALGGATRFYARLEPAPMPALAAASLADRLEAYLQREWQYAAAFVSDPAMGTLFGPSNPAVEAFVGQVEHYLATEQRQVAGFVRDPAAERLFSGSAIAPSPPSPAHLSTSAAAVTIPLPADLEAAARSVLGGGEDRR